MPFYLYGTKEDMNLDHMLVCSPNIQLSADSVTLKLDIELSADQLAKGLIVKADAYSEVAMQPFPDTETVLAQKSFFFQAGRSFHAQVFEDTKSANAHGPGLDDTGSAKPIATGLVKLGGNIFVDSDKLNEDPFFVPDKYPMWKAEFDKIGKELA